MLDIDKAQARLKELREQLNNGDFGAQTYHGIALELIRGYAEALDLLQTYRDTIHRMSDFVIPINPPVDGPQ